MTKPLPWFPLDADEWINRTALLSLEETGGLLVAVLAAWNASARGDEPGTLPASDDALARLLGPKWAAVMPVVRQHFTEHPDNPTRLRCEWLVRLYAVQIKRHESAVERGKQGGWPKGKKRKTNSPAIAQLSSSSTERDPVGGSFGAPTTGGVAASAGRGGATAASPPEPRTTPPGPPAPATVSIDEARAWGEQHPDTLAAIERDVETTLDDEQPKWRDRPIGPSLRTRRIEAALIDEVKRDRLRATLPPLELVGASPPSHSPGPVPGAAHAA